MKIDDTIEVMEKLTKSEKRFISIAVSRISKSEEPTEQHFRLYNLLSSIVKDAEKVKSTAKDNTKVEPEEQERFIESRISEERSRHPKLFTSLNVIRLYDFIFSTLRLMNADKPDYKLDNYIQDIQILQSKGLDHQVLDLIEKAKKEAREEEKFMSDLKVLQFLMLERKTHLTRRKEKDYDAIKKLEQSCNEQYERIKCILDTMHDQEVIQYHSIKGKVPDEAIDEVSPVFKLLLKKPEARKRLPFDAALRGLFATSVYLKRDRFEHEEDFKKMSGQIEHMIQLFKDHDQRKSRNPEYYIKSLLALANSCIETGQGKPFHDYLDEFKEAIGIDPDRPMEEEITNITIDKHTTRDYYTLIHVFTSYYVAIGDFGIAVKIIRHIKASIETYKPPTGHLMAIYWLIASVYFLTKDYVSARTYVNKLLDEKIPKRVREDIVFQAGLLDVLLIYEGDREEESQLLVQQKIGTMITELSKLGKDKNSPHIQDTIRDAQALLSALFATFSSPSEEATLEEFTKLYQKLTKDRGDFITGVFPLWARQKIESFSSYSHSD